MSPAYKRNMAISFVLLLLFSVSASLLREPMLARFGVWAGPLIGLCAVPVFALNFFYMVRRLKKEAEREKLSQTNGQGR